MDCSRAAVHSLSWVFLFGVFGSSLAFLWLGVGVCACACVVLVRVPVRLVWCFCGEGLCGPSVLLPLFLRWSCCGLARVGFRSGWSSWLSGFSSSCGCLRYAPSEGAVQTGSASLVQSVYSALQPCRQLSNSDVAAHGSSSRFRQSSRSVSCWSHWRG